MKKHARAQVSMLALLCATASAGLFGCNSDNTQKIEPDWIHDTTTDSAPLPSTTPTATPSVTPTVTPSPTITPSPKPTQATTDLYNGPADVAKYVQKFIDDAKAQGVDVLPDMKNPKLEIQIASLDNLGSSVIGLCETGNGKRRVTFDPDFWNKVSETQRELLAHHELGHCVLYRTHLTTTLSSGAYASIMYPIIMSSSTYLNNYAYYQQELFSRNAQSELGPDANLTHICTTQELGL